MNSYYNVAHPLPKTDQSQNSPKPGTRIRSGGKKRVKYEKANAELGPRLISPCSINFLENVVLTGIEDIKTCSSNFIGTYSMGSTLTTNENCTQVSLDSIRPLGPVA